MTVAIGYVYDEGIVFCADTKVTTSIKTNESKLQYFASDDGCCAMIFTMASDDVVFPKAAVTRCWEMVRTMDFATASMDAVRNTAQFALGEFYRDHIYTHPDRTPGADYFEMLLGIWLRNSTRLYVLHETILIPVDDYECIGAGAYLSKYLIRQYRKANPGKSVEPDATLMAEYCVKAAIDYDERCGGEPDMLVMRNSGEIDNACKTALYPLYLIGSLQSDTWEFIRELAEVQTQGTTAERAPELVNKFCERVREAEISSRICFASRKFSKRPANQVSPNRRGFDDGLGSNAITSSTVQT